MDRLLYLSEFLWVIVLLLFSHDTYSDMLLSGGCECSCGNIGDNGNVDVSITTCGCELSDH